MWMVVAERVSLQCVYAHVCVPANMCVFSVCVCVLELCLCICVSVCFCVCVVFMGLFPSERVKADVISGYHSQLLLHPIKTLFCAHVFL